MNKKFKHVFRRGREFTFRLTIAGEAFMPAETWENETDCAFAADTFKLFLLRQYKLPAALFHSSLPHPLFVSMLAGLGVDTHNLQDLFFILPFSCKEWIESGHGPDIRERVNAVKGFAGL